MVYRLTLAAEEQIDAVLLDSVRDHGVEAAGRYARLILTAIAALGDDPYLVGAVEMPRVPGVLAYPIRRLSQRARPGDRVGNPRHLVVYRLGVDEIVEVLGLVHDRMVLSRAARGIVRGADKE